MDSELLQDEVQLDERLSRPTLGVLQSLEACLGDVVILGVARKMGLTLARMARRGLNELGRKSDRVIGVARFSNPAAQDDLWGMALKPSGATCSTGKPFQRFPTRPMFCFWRAKNSVHQAARN